MTDFIHLHRCVETPWNDPRSFGDAISRAGGIGAQARQDHADPTGEAGASNLSTDLRERLDGKPRNITIQPRIHEVAVMIAVAAAIGFWLAVGHS